MNFKKEILPFKEIGKYDYNYDFDSDTFFVSDKISGLHFPFESEQEAVDYIINQNRIEKLKIVLNKDE